jgi:Skp family chaperone for outer membrane proteins
MEATAPPPKKRISSIEELETAIYPFTVVSIPLTASAFLIPSLYPHNKTFTPILARWRIATLPLFLLATHLSLQIGTGEGLYSRLTYPSRRRLEWELQNKTQEEKQLEEEVKWKKEELEKKERERRERIAKKANESLDERGTLAEELLRRRREAGRRVGESVSQVEAEVKQVVKEKTTSWSDRAQTAWHQLGELFWNPEGMAVGLQNERREG